MNLGVIFVSEMVGTAMLLLLGCGVVANVALAKTKGNGGGFLLVNFGWGLAVFAGVIVSVVSGAHINPAVTLGLAANILGKGGTEFVAGIPIDAASISTYIGAQLIGAILGAVASPGSPTSSTSTTSPSRRSSSRSSRPAPPSAPTRGTSSRRSSARSCSCSS